MIKRIYKFKSDEFKEFNSKLIPTFNKDLIIGIKTPYIKKLAKELNEEEINAFLNEKHLYFEEFQLHAFILNNILDYNKCLNYVLDFLKDINNWATCDQLNPKAFNNHRLDLLDTLLNLLDKSNYEIRFSIRMFMKYFLTDLFNEDYLIKIINIKSSDYYVNMMISWYLCEALIKQYDVAIKYFIDKKIDKWVNNMAIKKAIESKRLDTIVKNHLNTLKF